MVKSRNIVAPRGCRVGLLVGPSVRYAIRLRTPVNKGALPDRIEVVRERRLISTVTVPLASATHASSSTPLTLSWFSPASEAATMVKLTWPSVPLHATRICSAMPVMAELEVESVA